MRLNLLAVIRQQHLDRRAMSERLNTLSMNPAFQQGGNPILFRSPDNVRILLE